MIPLDDYYKKGYYYFQPDFLILLNKHKFITYQINLGAQFIFPILDLTTIFKMRSYIMGECCECTSLPTFYLFFPCIDLEICY